MLRINLQLFAHKKGLGSSKNGRDSESKRLGVKKACLKAEAAQKLCAAGFENANKNITGSAGL